MEDGCRRGLSTSGARRGRDPEGFALKSADLLVLRRACGIDDAEAKWLAQVAGAIDLPIVPRLVVIHWSSVSWVML